MDGILKREYVTSFQMIKQEKKPLLQSKWKNPQPGNNNVFPGQKKTSAMKHWSFFGRSMSIDCQGNHIGVFVSGASVHHGFNVNCDIGNAGRNSFAGIARTS